MADFLQGLLILIECCTYDVNSRQIKQRFLSNTTFQNYDDIIERSCQAWNEILSEDGFIENLCSREWSFLV
jgi:hypothetical protein